MAPWPGPPADGDLARSLWADAATILDVDLDRLLAVSWSGRCLPYLPAEVVDAVDPPEPAVLDAYAHANVLDARDLWLAGKRDGDAIFAESYALRVTPLSPTVRSLLRPRRGIPRTA